jgi:para-nitrobenzyl esterase
MGENMSDLVETSAGTVRGVAGIGVIAFKGVPYGNDTGGQNRFRPPQPVLPWTGVRDCTDYGPSCPQVAVGQMTGQDLPDEIEQMLGVWNREREMSEDCLVLNVWTPAADDRARPVLVWLHGGGMSVGSASWPLYDFTNLARNNDVVVVGINHRVGILAFLDLSHLGDEFADSGNCGMLDIVASLEWVRDNIAAFGGDPSNVTIFGESGGGSKATCLLGMPAAKGLFRSAFPMSGALLHARTKEASLATANEVVEALGGSADAERLRTIEWAALVDVELGLLRKGGMMSAGPGFGPTLGPSLPQHPVEAVHAGSAAGVNVVIGCTTHEMIAFLATPDLWVADDETVRQRIQWIIGEDAERLLAVYRNASPEDSMASHFLLMASDRTMRVPHVRFAEALLDGGAPQTRMYLFDYRVLGPDGVARSGHGSDMPYAFDNVDKAAMAQGPHAEPLVRAMSGALAALARTGSPDHDGLPRWPIYSRSERPTMLIDVVSHVELDPMAAQRAAWDGIDFAPRR